MKAIHVCSVKYLFIYGPQKQKKEKKRHTKSIFGTQINAEGNHKLLIDFGRSALLCDGKTSYEK